MSMKLSTFLFERDEPKTKHGEEKKTQIVNITAEPEPDLSVGAATEYSTSVPSAFKIRLVTP